MNQRVLDLPVKIFADGADLQGIADLYRQPYIHGLTTNPTLMRKGRSDRLRNIRSSSAQRGQIETNLV